MGNVELLRKLGFAFDTDCTGLYTLTHKGIGERFTIDPNDSRNDFNGFIESVVKISYDRGRHVGDIEAKNKIRKALGIDDGYYAE